MIRRQTVLAALLGLLAFVQAAVADDLLPTYRDDFEESERLGIISLTGTSANYTINLTGVLLLGLALAAAVTLYAYLHTFLAKSGKGYGGHYGGYEGGSSYGGSSYKLTTSAANYTINLTGVLMLGLAVAAASMVYVYLSAFGVRRSGRYGHGGYGHGYGKRSVDDELTILPVVLSNMHKRFEEAEIDDIACKERIVCETAQSGQSHAFNTFGHAVNTFFGNVEKNEDLLAQVKVDKDAKIYFEAWKLGKRGKSCKAVFEKCALPKARITSVLQAQ